MAHRPKPKRVPSPTSSRAAQHSSPPAPAPTPGLPSRHEASGILTIDLGAIVANYKMLLARVMPGECAAVVKGDAYGCGLEQVTPVLARAGCQDLLRRASVGSAARARDCARRR